MPSQKIPNRLSDVIHLLNRLLSLHCPLARNADVIISLYHTGSVHRSMAKCRLTFARMKDVLRLLKNEYQDLKAHTPDGVRTFTLKELVMLIGGILSKVVIRPILKTLIQAYDDTDGDYKKICDKYQIPVRTYHYYLNKYIKKPYVEFCAQR
ncbi:MAG: hypothetical protein HY762_04360 [Planctomycetes bacterium]|nr:hypothetical protein [Planctomycetota bacterium]